MNRLTTRRTDNGLAYLVGVKPNEQEVDSPHPNTLRCILDCFERLDQLLSEIEKHNYKWGIFCDDVSKIDGTHGYSLDLYDSNGFCCASFDADSPEEATAQALLWILKQEVRP